MRHQSLKTLICALFITASLCVQAQSDNILSVDGLDFGAGIAIMWETLDAPDAGQTFVVERAMDAKDEFVKIGEVTVDSDNDAKQFSFEDRELGLEKAFYRIRVVDSEAGTESYTEVLPVTKDVINNFKIQETEQIDKYQYRVSVISIVEDELKFQMATNMGEVILKETLQMVEGENDFLVDLEAEADGSYVVSFQNGAYTITKNFKKKSEKEDNVARKD